MTHYIIITLVTLFLTYFSEKELKNNNKKSGISLLIIAAVFISIYAGVRDLSVGTDIMSYITRIFDSSPYYSLLEIMKLTNSEFGIVLLGMISSKIFGNIHIYLFAVELIIISSIFKFAYDSRDKSSMTLTMMIYMLLCFPESLCIMKQSIAFAIGLNALKCFENKDFKKYFALLFIGLLFHSSIIIFIPISLLYRFSNKRKETNKIYLYFLSALAFLCLINIGIIMQTILNYISVIPNRYIVYFQKINIYGNTSYVNETINLFKGRTIYYLLWILFLYHISKNNKENFEKQGLALAIFSLCIYILSTKYIILSRIATMILNIVLVKHVPELIGNKPLTKQKVLNLTIIVLLLISNFFFTYVKDFDKVGSYGVYPYTIGNKDGRI